MRDSNGGPIRRAIRAATGIRPNELKATFLSFLFIFVLMAAYFILRPVRDAMASDFSDVELSTLWTGTFLFSVPAVVLYGAVIPHVRFDRLVPSVYAFFAATFLGFYFAASALHDAIWLDKLFYVWISVFSLFHLSVFWSFMSGLFNREQAKRTFAIIATGASAGAVVGPAIATFFADDIGTLNLMLIAAVMLLVPIPLIGVLERLKVSDLGNAELKADLSRQLRLGKNPFSGFTLLFRNRYLLGIAVFILLYVTMNTFFYFEIRDLLRDFERATRTQWWGGIDLVVNSLAVLIAVFGTGRLATRFGMSTTLALLPVLMVGGWLLIAAAPVLPVIVALQIARRAGNYAITRPGREMLFTLVDQEMRYKSKPVIDIVVYRGGDMVTAWAYTGITAAFALGISGIAIIAAVIAALWALSGLLMGRRYDRAPESAVVTAGD
ncbi:MAG: NTP/NDP exchange transporter [Woeseiaceae bacterium]